MSSVKTLNANAEVMGSQAVRPCPCHHHHHHCHHLSVLFSFDEARRAPRVSLAVTRSVCWDRSARR